MKAEQVDKALAQKFLTEEERLVFWHDTNGEFSDYIARPLPAELEAVTVVDVAKQGGLPTKLLLERQDTSGKYLLYSTGETPRAEEDWLLDIRLYSATFHADVASIWRQELGLSGLYLREHLKARSTFLGSQERRKKLKKLIAPDDDEAAIDLKMMAVLAESEVANLFAILRGLCHGHAQDGPFNLDEPPKSIALFEKMGLAEEFWKLVNADFGYAQPTPNLAGLLRRLFVSEFLHQLDGERIAAIAQFELPAAGRQNAVVCLTQWRDSSTKAKSYDEAAKAVAKDIKLGDHLGSLSLESIRELFTFWEVERRVLSALKERVLSETLSMDAEAIAAIATARKAGYWLSGPESHNAARQAAADAYDAIASAAKLFALRNKHEASLSFDDSQALLSAYQDELYRYDQLYRRFYVKAASAQKQGWDLLKTLTDEVERCYDNGFLQPLGLECSRLLDAGFLDSWVVSNLPAQRAFFADTIQPYLDQSDRKRAFVIISDAFRYEAAAELTEQLNGRYRLEAKLSGMLGVLPSYTTLGMASLLPHRTLSYSEKGDVLVNGKSAASTDARNNHLATVDGMACQAKELRVMKTDEARAFTRGKRVVYIYHNVIDARGDTASTEHETFAAVNDCLSELVELVQFCVGKLNAATVWVTADHGFLFQEKAPSQTDKSKLSHKPENSVKIKKRYAIGRQLGTTPEAHHGSTDITAGTESGMEFWIPRGANRFHFTGGARFIHGGAMPQEVLVPLVEVSQLRGKKAEKSKIDKVSLQVLGSKHKITTPTYRFEVIQLEAISERRQPLSVQAAVYDGAVAVTSVVGLTLDSASESLEDRKKSIRLELRTGQYDKTKPYRLVLRDAETDTEVQSVPVIIDRSFDDDF